MRSVFTVEEEGLPTVLTVGGKYFFAVDTVGVEGSMDGEDHCILFAHALFLNDSQFHKIGHPQKVNMGMGSTPPFQCPLNVTGE